MATHESGNPLPPLELVAETIKPVSEEEVPYWRIAWAHMLRNEQNDPPPAGSRSHITSGEHVPQAVLARITAQRLQEEAAAAAASINPFAGKFYTPASLYAMHQPADWLVHGLLCRGDVAMLFGDSGVGKSFLALDLAVALACGAPAWGGETFPIPAPRRVVYCSGEGTRGLRKRVYAAEERYRAAGLPEAGDNLRVLPMVPQLYDRGDPCNMGVFLEACRTEGIERADLVILDTLNRVTYGAEENSNSAAAIVLARLAELQAELHCATLLLHHTNRASGSYRGASAYKAGMDLMLEVRREDELRGILRCEKMKDGETFDALDYALEVVDTQFADDGRTCVVNWNGRHTATPVTVPDLLRQYAESEMAQSFRTVRDVAEELKRMSGLTFTPNTVLMALNRASEKEGLFCYRLLDPDRPSSRHNPTVFRAS